MIPSPVNHLKTASLTHPGMSGKNNEDRYAIASFRTSEEDSTPVLFALIADGVGGKLAGELAAQIAVDMIPKAGEESDGSDPTGTLQQALLDANQAILERAQRNSDTQGMGTTATAAWVSGDRLYAVNVGNSRLYLMRAGKLRRISIDHSWVQEAIDHGILTPEQARDHPNARIITRHLGSESAEPDLRIQLSANESEEQMLANQGMQLLPADMLLLCSDGLSDVVEDGEIEDAIRRHTMADALQALTDLANARGGPDNITSILLKLPGKRPQPAAAGRKRKPGIRLGVSLTALPVPVPLLAMRWRRLPGRFP